MHIGLKEKSNLKQNVHKLFSVILSCFKNLYNHRQCFPKLKEIILSNVDILCRSYFYFVFNFSFKSSSHILWWFVNVCFPSTVSVAATWATTQCFGSLTTARRWSFAAAHVTLLSLFRRLTPATISANVSTAGTRA